MSHDPFFGILDPFAWWDIGATYDRYAGFFDLVIYSSIFIAVAHVVFTSRFSGRAGKALASTIGIALGVSLAVVETQFGWNLRQAGPIAVLIALLLTGFLVMNVLLRIHVSWRLAVPLSYVLVYLMIRGMSPALFGLIAERVPFLGLLSAVVLLICIWQLGVALWPRRRENDGPGDATFVAGMNEKRERREIKVEKNIKRHMIPEAQRETARLERNLRVLLHECKREQPDWQGINRALSDIAHRADDVIRIIDRIRTLDRRLRAFDWHEIQNLSAYYQDLNDEDKERLREQIMLERRKVLQEHAIVELTERCERRHAEFRRVLDQAAAAGQSEDRTSLEQNVTTAISIEDQQAADMQTLRTAEGRLLQLTKTKLRKE